MTQCHAFQCDNKGQSFSFNNLTHWNGPWWVALIGGFLTVKWRKNCRCLPTLTVWNLSNSLFTFWGQSRFTSFPEMLCWFYHTCVMFSTMFFSFRHLCLCGLSSLSTLICQCSTSHSLIQVHLEMLHTATVHWFRLLKGTTAAIRSFTWGSDVGKWFLMER